MQYRTGNCTVILVFRTCTVQLAPRRRRIGVHVVAPGKVGVLSGVLISTTFLIIIALIFILILCRHILQLSIHVLVGVVAHLHADLRRAVAPRGDHPVDGRLDAGAPLQAVGTAKGSPIAHRPGEELNGAAVRLADLVAVGRGQRNLPVTFLVVAVAVVVVLLNHQNHRLRWADLIGLQVAHPVLGGLVPAVVRVEVERAHRQQRPEVGHILAVGVDDVHEEAGVTRSQAVFGVLRRLKADARRVEAGDAVQGASAAPSGRPQQVGAQRVAHGVGGQTTTRTGTGTAVSHGVHLTKLPENGAQPAAHLEAVGRRLRVLAQANVGAAAPAENHHQLTVILFTLTRQNGVLQLVQPADLLRREEAVRQDDQTLRFLLLLSFCFFPIGVTIQVLANHSNCLLRRVGDVYQEAGVFGGSVRLRFTPTTSSRSV